MSYIVILMSFQTFSSISYGYSSNLSGNLSVYYKQNAVLWQN